MAAATSRSRPVLGGSGRPKSSEMDFFCAVGMGLECTSSTPGGVPGVHFSAGLCGVQSFDVQWIARDVTCGTADEFFRMEFVMSVTMTGTHRNGIDLVALQETVDKVRANPAAAQTQWALNSRWVGGTRSDHVVDGCRISGEDIDRGFTICVDEPRELCGTNQFANPQEHLLASINSCMMVGYAAAAAHMGIKLTKLEIRICGDIDLRGFLGIDESVAPGYELLQQTVTIAGDGTEEQFRQLHEIVKKTSPNYFNITHAIATESRLVVE